MKKRKKSIERTRKQILKNLSSKKPILGYPASFLKKRYSILTNKEVK